VGGEGNVSNFPMFCLLEVDFFSFFFCFLFRPDCAPLSPLTSLLFKSLDATQQLKDFVLPWNLKPPPSPLLVDLSVVVAPDASFSFLDVVSFPF